jgi:proton glutamate symport protein
MLAGLKRVSLSAWMLAAMFVGGLLGWLFPEQAVQLKVVSTVFLNLVKCIIVPLIFSTLVVGVASHADNMRAVGRLAFRSLVYFEILTTLALFIGLAAVNCIAPGKGLHLQAAAESAQKMDAHKITLAGVVDHLAPHSFFDAAAQNDVLQVVVFALFFAVALTRVKEKPRQTMLGFCEALAEVMFKFTGLVMCLAPFGVGAAVASTIGLYGFRTFGTLGLLVLTLYAALAVFVLVVLVPVMLLARVPVLGFFKTVREPAVLAFSTASSEAALPDALRRMEQIGVPRRIVSFVLPAGYAFNLDGSTLYLAVASIFVAQAAGVPLSLSQQLPIMLTLMLTSKGVAAVPRASLVILSGTLTTFGLPLEGVALILGVDAFLDMARTSINLVGNCLAAAVMARWEGEFHPPALASQPVSTD